MYFFIFTYIYIYLCIVYMYIIYMDNSFQIEHWDQNSNVEVFDHKTTFPDTHRHFRPRIEISRNFPIVCGGLELKKNNLKSKSCLDMQASV